MSARGSAIAELLLLFVVGSLVAVLAKLALREVPPFSFVWLQIATGGIALTLYTFGLRRERVPRGLGRDVWISIAAIGITYFTLSRVFFMFALERLPATTHAYLINFTGVVTMLMSIAILRERPSRFQVVGAVLALAGLRVFFREIPPPDEVTGVLYMLVAVLALAAYNTVARGMALGVGAGLSNNVVSTVALWIGGAPVVVAGLALDWPPQVVGWQHWAIVVLNGVVGVALTLAVFNRVLRTLRSFEASLLASSGVIYTALFAIPILGEALALHQVAGIALMLIGLALVQVRRSALRA